MLLILSMKRTEKELNDVLNSFKLYLFYINMKIKGEGNNSFVQITTRKEIDNRDEKLIRNVFNIYAAVKM